MGICHNCKGKGTVNGSKKAIKLNSKFEPKRDSKCYYCKGNGSR